jgi:DNA-binding transcriptional regulator YiaG
MAIKVLLSKEFLLNNEEEVLGFRSLVENGWSIRREVILGGEAPASPATEAAKKRDALGKKVSAIIQRLREQHDIRPADVSRLTGISQTTICHWRKGRKSPSAKTLKKFRSLERRAKKLPNGDSTLKLESLTALNLVRIAQVSKSASCLDTHPR